MSPSHVIADFIDLILGYNLFMLPGKKNMAMVRLYAQEMVPKASRFKPELCYLVGLWKVMSALCPFVVVICTIAIIRKDYFFQLL